jgi:hypothetical protein
LSQAPALFGRRGKSRSEAADAELKDELYRQIGRLKMELDWLKKKGSSPESVPGKYEI